MGRILSRAISDARRYLKGGFSIPITFKTGSEEFELNGLATVHSQNFDQDDRPVIGENSHICFSEKDVIDMGIVTRSGNNLVLVKSWVVSFDHAIGNFTAILSEPEPDSTLGIIRVKITSFTE